MSPSYTDSKNCIKSNDVMDFLHEQYLFWEFVAFVMEQLKKTNLSYLKDMQEKPYKYVDEFNQFMALQQKVLDVQMPHVTQ